MNGAFLAAVEPGADEVDWGSRGLARERKEEEEGE